MEGSSLGLKELSNANETHSSIHASVPQNILTDKNRSTCPDEEGARRGSIALQCFALKWGLPQKLSTQSVAHQILMEANPPPKSLQGFMQSVAKLHTGKTLVVHNRFQAMLIFIEQLVDYHFGQSCSILRVKESQGFSQIDIHGEDGRLKATAKIVQMLHHIIVYFTQFDAVKGTESSQRIQLDLTKQVNNESTINF